MLNLKILFSLIISSFILINTLQIYYNFSLFEISKPHIKKIVGLIIVLLIGDYIYNCKA